MAQIRHARAAKHSQGDVLITSSFYSNSPEKSHQRRRDDSVSYRHFTHSDILAYENLLDIKNDL